MRWLIVVAGLLIADSAHGQAATVNGPKIEGPAGWTDSEDFVRLGRAGISLPRKLRGFSLTETQLNDPAGFDGFARYQRGDEFLTIFLYQPIDNAARLQWNGAVNAVRRRLADRNIVGERVEAAPTAHGDAVLASFDSGTTADILMFGRLDNGWNVKLRLTARPSIASAREDAAALFDAISLPEQHRLIAPDMRPIPSCEPLETAKSPKPQPVSGGERLQVTLTAATALAAVGTDIDTTDWCAAGSTQIGPIPVTLYRAPVSEGTAAYRVPLGDSGAMLKLDRAPLPIRKADWWLRFDRSSDSIVLQLLRGAGDDADMLDFVARLQQLMNAPVTVVGRD